MILYITRNDMYGIKVSQQNPFFPSNFGSEITCHQLLQAEQDPSFLRYEYSEMFSSKEAVSDAALIREIRRRQVDGTSQPATEVPSDSTTEDKVQSIMKLHESIRKETDATSLGLSQQRDLIRCSASVFNSKQFLFGWFDPENMFLGNENK